MDRSHRSLRFAILLASLISWSAAPVLADGLDVVALSQTPANVVPRSARSITYQIRTRNFDAGGEPTTIGVGIEIRIDGRRVNANSGEITSSGCSVDRDFPNFWACNNLGEGGSQTPTFDWLEPRPGTSVVEFIGFCQVLPIPPGGFQPCTTARRDSFTTIVANQPPNGVIDQPAGNVVIEAGGEVVFAGTGSDPEGDTPLRFFWSFDGGAPNSTLEDPGAVVFATPGVYKVTFTVTDVFGSSDPTPASVAVTVTAPVCGNGQVESGELCDDGALNGQEGSCCSTRCDFRSAGTVCGPAIAFCLEDAVCSGTSAICPPTTLSPAGKPCGNPPAGACDVQDVCNGVDQNCAEIVAAPGTVCGGASGLCDLVDTCDGRTKNCTDRIASVGTLCRAAVGACDASDFCDGQTKTCVDTSAPSGTLCSDGDACTSGDACNGTGGCIAGLPLDCDDEQFCNGVESCQSPVGCVAGTPPVVDDGIACTEDGCDEAIDAIVHTPNDALCSGALVCQPAVGCVQGCLDLEGQPCETGLPGICGDGLFECPNGQFGEPACAQLQLPEVEICNALDDDCDASADEDFVGVVDSCGLGICFNEVAVCVAGVPQQCAPLPGLSEEVCENGLDDDCNGIEDDPLVCALACSSYEGQSCETGLLGSCSEGRYTCPDGDAGQPVCRALREPVPERCDAQDADCDGQVECGFADWGEDLELANGLVFVAAQQAGLRIVAPGGSTLLEIGAFDPGSCTDSLTTRPLFVDDVEIDAAAELAFLAAGDCGVLIVDVRLPDPLPPGWSPPQLASFDTAGWTQDVDVVGGLAYVADHNGGLAILDVSGLRQGSPRPPRQIGGVGFLDSRFGAAIDVEVSGGFAYVATTTGLQIVDVSDPEQPEVRGRFATDPARGPGQDAEVVRDPRLGTLVYLSAWLDGVYVIDANVPEIPVEIARLPTSSASYETTVIGITALVADGEDGLRLYDVSLPASPVERSGSPFATPGWAWDMEIEGELAYVAHGEDPFGRSLGGLVVLTLPQLGLGVGDVLPIPEPGLSLQMLAALAALVGIAAATRARRLREGRRPR